MKSELNEQFYKNFWSFLIETFTFAEEENAALDFQIPMTQELFDSMLDKCFERSEELDPTFHKLSTNFPEFLKVYEEEWMRKIENIAVPEWSEEERKEFDEKFYAKLEELQKNSIGKGSK